MNEIKEKKLNKYPEIVSLESTDIIINQMKKYIFKICLNDGSKGTGFFCSIPFIDNKELGVLITNNHVINLEIEKITISINNDKEIKEIELKNRIKYTNKEYDITIIEIKEEDNINNYLELDENIMRKGSNNLYINNTIYIIQYPEGKYEDEKYNFKHLCCTEVGSSGSPIINLINNKVIGIHKGTDIKNKYNKGLFINYAIEDFINKNNIIREFNKNFNLNLQDNDNLEKLNLTKKVISNIEKLEKIRIDNLKELDLSYNEISDIKVLEKVEFKDLKELNLNGNKISDLEVLEKVKFGNLLKLDLCYNEISDIKVLEKVKFKYLEGLYLSGNKILGIEILEKVKFEFLKELDLSYNEISNIEVLEKVQFKDLKILYMNYNKISDIKVLEKVNFENLESLHLSNNKISDIKVLEKVKFNNLKELYLYNNEISDIKVLEKVKFENLKELYLYNKEINKINDSSLINNLKNKYTNLFI